MEQISTQEKMKPYDKTDNTKTKIVKEITLDFIKQFARAYVPVSNMPGLVLN